MGNKIMGDGVDGLHHSPSLFLPLIHFAKPFLFFIVQDILNSVKRKFV